MRINGHAETADYYDSVAVGTYLRDFLETELQNEKILLVSGDVDSENLCFVEEILFRIAPYVSGGELALTNDADPAFHARYKFLLGEQVWLYEEGFVIYKSDLEDLSDLEKGMSDLKSEIIK